MKMFNCLILVSVFTMSAQYTKRDVLQCEPRNVTLKTQFPDQMLLLTWQDDPFCSRKKDVLTYEVAVILTDNVQQVDLHHDAIVNPDPTVPTHSWNWTSPWPLECANYTVKLSSSYNNLTSQRRYVERIPAQLKAEVFPKDRVFEVGRNFSFCCILGIGEEFTKMTIMGYEANELITTKISNGVYAVTAHLRNPSPYSCTNVLCGVGSGACVYVGYPPSDMDLKCETRDLDSVECHWNKGRDTHLSGMRSTVYHLLGRQCSSPCQKNNMCSCRQNVQENFGEKNNWTLTAQNELGIVGIVDTSDMAERVHMYPPGKVIASSVNARNACLEWQWSIMHYNNLHVECQIKLHYNGNMDMRNDTGVGLKYTVLPNLIPNQKYTVQVRCAAKPFWTWSDWAQSTFHTQGDIPEALDVWMMMEKKLTIIIWKPLIANQSHGQILDYEVTWRTATAIERQKKIIFPPKNSAALSLRVSEEHIITVTARNRHGSSPPSAVTTPRLYSEMKPSEIIGSHGGFDLSWSASPAATCGYVVDWCVTFGQCTMEWLKVPTTNARIVSDNFIDGVRYSLSIYACTIGAPELLEKREGYVREQKIPEKLVELKKWEQLGTDVKVFWAAVPPRNQTAFIRGYIMYYTEHSSHVKTRNMTLNVSTGDPEACNLTARELRISTYTFTVKALSSAGDGGDISITVTMNQPGDKMITVLTVSLILTSVFLSLGTFLCYRKWTCIKQKIYPQIPKPVLTEDWLTLLRSNGLGILNTDPCLHSEVDTVDVSELHCKLVPMSVGVCKKDGLHAVMENTAPNGYYQPAPYSSISPHTISPTLMLPPRLPFGNVFENPLYNVVVPHSSVKTQGPGPLLFYQDSGLSVRNGDYQPQ